MNYFSIYHLGLFLSFPHLEEDDGLVLEDGDPSSFRCFELVGPLACSVCIVFSELGIELLLCANNVASLRASSASCCF